MLSLLMTITDKGIYAITYDDDAYHTSFALLYVIRNGKKYIYDGIFVRMDPNNNENYLIANIFGKGRKYSLCKLSQLIELLDLTDEETETLKEVAYDLICKFIELNKI